MKNIYKIIMTMGRLKLMPFKKWGEIKSILKLDFPRSIYGYTYLENMEYFEKKGIGYGAKVYCPMGDPLNGIVALNLKPKLYEVIVQCPRDDTHELEEALRTTKLIDWTQEVKVPLAPTHVMSSVKKIINEKSFKINHLIPSITLLLDKDTPPFDVSLPRGYSFETLTLKDLQKINDTWPHKYPGSDWYLDLLIRANFGYGLFKDNELLTWVFVKEGGDLGHFYTLDAYRKHGYGMFLAKLFVNTVLKNKKDIFFSCVKTNTVAMNIYKQLGFKPIFEEEWCYFTSPRNK